MEQRLKILGIASISLGALAAALCFINYGFVFAVPASFLGMVVSVIYVYTDTKYNINTSKFTAGIFGLLLSSVPVLIILYFILFGKS